MAQENQSQSDEKFDEKEWLHQKHGKVQQYASRNTLDLTRIIQKDSAILLPFVAVWFIESKSNLQVFWVITGDLPLDHIVGDNAQSARDAIKYFSLRWQLKAENIFIKLEQESSEVGSNNTKKQFAAILISRADTLYQFADKDDLWKNN